MKNLLWLSDIHLDRASDKVRKRFLTSLKTSAYDGVLITGDISTSEFLREHLAEIARACGSRPVLFITGNHDYFGSSFFAVDRLVAYTCKAHSNLIALGGGEVIHLTKNTALVAHRGWFDGVAGAGVTTRVESPDRYQIDDFKTLNRDDYFEALGELGKQSANYFRKVLPLALSRYKNVMLATHVPPFTQAVRYDDKGCVWGRQPYFANTAVGKLIWGLSQHYHEQNIEVYAGHTHSAASVMLGSNLLVRVAAAKPGKPTLGEILVIK